MITVHIETIDRQGLEAIKNKFVAGNVKLGVSLNPGTPLEKIKEVLDLADFILVMSVNPGFAGQEFIPGALPKIRELRRIFKGDISVDGGISDKVSGELIKAGATILAAGSYIFKASDVKLSIERMRDAG